MLVAMCSAKGAPGVTSGALALAASWPRPVVLVEADPDGGDLAYRCQTVAGGPMYAAPNLPTLTAAIRGGIPGPQVLSGNAQRLACGVDLVQGAATTGQVRGLAGLWPVLAQACRESEVDVIVDVGRLDATSPAFALAEAADVLVWVASSSLESVMHLRDSVGEVARSLDRRKVATVVPLIVGDDTHAGRDCADLDAVLAAAGLPVQPTQHLPYDPKALVRLERGESAGGRLGRTLLIRGARAVSGFVLEGSGKAGAA